jgi:hypothetical protein
MASLRPVRVSGQHRDQDVEIIAVLIKGAPPHYLVSVWNVSTPRKGVQYEQVRVRNGQERLIRQLPRLRYGNITQMICMVMYLQPHSWGNLRCRPTI